MKNYLLDSIHQLYKELAYFDGRINTLNWFLNRHRNNDKLTNSKSRNPFFTESILTFRDLSNLTSTNYLSITGYGYSLKADDIKDEIDNILSREYCFTLSQSYEAFETYLIKILTNFLLHNQNHLGTLKLTNANLIHRETFIKELVREKLARRKNNKDLLGAMRKLSTHFKEHEIKNIHDINVCTWFDLLSEVRHNIVHNRQVISNILLKHITTNEKNKLFETYFDRKKINNEIHIFLSNHKFALNFQLLNQFGYFIFKSLSLEGNLDPIYKT